MSESKITIGTRGSALALVQAEATERALGEIHPELKVVREVIRTTGDRRTDVALKDVAKSEGVLDKGVFTKELELALSAGEIDIAVHSLKDVPTVLSDEFEIAGTLERAPIRDVLVTLQPGGLEALPEGSVVGTSSVRRAKQLLWLRPDLEVVDMRGNVPTRLRKVTTEAYDATLLAEAGLVRLGYDLAKGAEMNDQALYFTALPEHEFYPAAAQGAIGFEIRKGDERAAELVTSMTHADTFLRAQAEREFLRLVDGGCHTPVGVFSRYDSRELSMAARLFPDEGGEPKSGEVVGRDPIETAQELFDSLV